MKRLAWGMGAVLVNVALLLLIVHAQPAAKPRPPREAWVVREIFQPAPPPRAQVSPEDVARSVPDQPSSPQELSPATSFEALPTEALSPRTLAPSFDIGPTGVAGGPPVPLPFGPPGGPLRQPSPSRPPAATLNLDQVDRAPEPVVTPLPPYPEWARIRRLVGIVTLKFVVDSEGAVRDVSIDRVMGDERFGPVAIEAVSGWKFQPAVSQGKNVAVRVSQTVRFRLVN